MAEQLSDAEILKLREIMTGWDGGKQIDDLPASDLTKQEKYIPVFNPSNGQTEYMELQDAVNYSIAPRFGRVWNESLSTPTAASWTGNVEFGRELAQALKLGCYLVKNDHSRRKLAATNHYLFETGELAKLDGSMGHYQWGWGVPFYLALYKAGGLWHEEISLRPIPGQYNYRIPVGSISAHGLACIDRDTNTLCSFVNDDAKYRGGNNNADLDGTYRTLRGTAVTSMTCEAMRAAARRNGAGWMCGTMRHSTVVKILFEIIFGTRDVQAAYNANLDADGLHQGGLGSGVTNWNGTAWNNYNGCHPFLPTSVGIELADGCGVVNYEVKDGDNNVIYTAPVPVFFGLKNLFGYLWHHQDDEFVRCNENQTRTHLVAPSIYGTWTIGNEEGMVAYSNSPDSEGYIKAISYDHLENFPTQVGGSASTYHCDYFWKDSSTSGFRLVLRGCDARNGSHAGSSAVNVYSAVSHSHAYIGSPLCEAEEEWPLEPVYAEAA